MVLAGELLPPGISLDKSTQVPIFLVVCFVQLFLSNQMEESHNKGTGFGTKTRLKVATSVLVCRIENPKNGHNVPPASEESKKDSGSVC